MQALCLTLCRLLIAAWCGAGTMFVVLVIRLRGSTLFDEATKLHHPQVLFPVFYQLEFVILSAAVLTGVLASGHPNLRGWRGKTLVLLLAGAWALAMADFTCVYQPLMAMLAAPHLPESFRTYHHLSRAANMAVLACGLAASLVACWPARVGEPPAGGTP